MAKGDVVDNITPVPTGDFMLVQPGAGKEWAVHNIYHEAEAELYIVEGTYELFFDTSGARGSWSAYFFHLTNTHYFKVKNTNAASKLMGYDGIVSKE